jgi:hypothetical protein
MNQLYFIPSQSLLYSPAEVKYRFYAIKFVNSFLKFQHMYAITILSKCYEVTLAHMAVSSLNLTYNAHTPSHVPKN